MCFFIRRWILPIGSWSKKCNQLQAGIHPAETCSMNPSTSTLTPTPETQFQAWKMQALARLGVGAYITLVPPFSSPPDPWSLSLGKATHYREGAAPWQLQAGYSREHWDGRNIFQLKSTQFPLHLSLGNIHDENLDSMTLCELWKLGEYYSGWCCLWLTLKTQSESWKGLAKAASAKDPVPSIF